MNLSDFLKLEKNATIKVGDWEAVKNLIYKLQLRIEELLVSRQKWREKYFELKNSPQ